MIRSLGPLIFVILVNLSLVLGSFNETLLLRPLCRDKILLHFQFEIDHDIFDKIGEINFRRYPKNIGQILTSFEVQEMQLTLTKSHWDVHDWGAPVISSPMGAELFVHFLENKSKGEIDELWTGVTHSLAGLLCNSLNRAADQGLSVAPDAETSAYASPGFQRTFGSVRHAAVPSEAVCTENLTPWLKLLPCRDRAGLASFLNPRLFTNPYVSIRLHALHKPGFRMLAVLSVSVVLDARALPRYGVDRVSLADMLDNGDLPAACPLASSSEVVVYAPFALGNAHSDGDDDDDSDTTSMSSGGGIIQDSGAVEDVQGRVDSSSSSSSSGGSSSTGFSLEDADQCGGDCVGEDNVPDCPPGSDEGFGLRGGEVDASQGCPSAVTGGWAGAAPAAAVERFDVSMTPIEAIDVPLLPMCASNALVDWRTTQVSVQQHVQESSGLLRRIVFTIVNRHPTETAEATLTSIVPNFVKAFAHTLQASVDGEDVTLEEYARVKNFVPVSTSREQGILQLNLRLPPGGRVLSVSMRFEKTLLHRSEYPPDAHRGFDWPAAAVVYTPAAFWREGGTLRGDLLFPSGLCAVHLLPSQPPFPPNTTCTFDPDPNTATTATESHCPVSPREPHMLTCPWKSFSMDHSPGRADVDESGSRRPGAGGVGGRSGAGGVAYSEACEIERRVVHARNTLVTLPTPDFSMPYNVITLTCTALAILLGSLMSVATKRFPLPQK
eukprot:Rmarinus@m.10961